MKKKLLPIFGDIHGRLNGYFDSMSYINNEFSLFPDLVLQVGDIGFFKDIPESEKIRDNDELDFHHYLNYPEFRKNILARNEVSYKTLFIRGNHEDQDTLKEFENNRKYGCINVDQKRNFCYIPDGRGLSIEGSTNGCTIYSFGGIDPKTRPNKFERNPNIGYSSEGFDRLLDASHCIDVLVTHQGPENTDGGSRFINDLIEAIRPKIHFHGHAHKRVEQYIDGVKSVGLSKMPKGRRPFLRNKDYFGFLNVDDFSFSFSKPGYVK